MVGQVRRAGGAEDHRNLEQSMYMVQKGMQCGRSFPCEMGAINVFGSVGSDTGTTLHID